MSESDAPPSTPPAADSGAATSASTSDSSGPNSNERERNWKTFLVQEWSLLLLAAAMTLTSWLIVREQIVNDHIIKDVWVELAVDSDMRERLGAVLTDENDRIDVELRCSEREKNEAVQALMRNGRPTVTLRIRQEPAADHRPFNADQDTFDWPFDARRILKNNEPPSVQVFRLSRRPALVEAPQTVREPGVLEAELNLKVDIQPKLPSVEMFVPEGVFDVPLTPDKVPIDPAEFTLRKDGTSYEPRQITLTFKNWRLRDDREAWRRAYRAQLKIQTIRAMITLTQVGSVDVRNRLLVQLDGDTWQVDTSDTRDSIEGIVSTLPLKFEGKLLGPKKVLDELAHDEGLTSAGKWSWGLVLKQDPETSLDDPAVTKDADGYMEVSAEIVWLPYADFKNRGVQFSPAAGETDFTVKVRRRP